MRFDCRIALPAALALLCAPQALSADRTISGELFYLPRIALQPEAEVVVSLRDGQDGTVAALRAPTAGRQVPLPFALNAPADRALTLHAAIWAAGRPLWSALALPLAAGEGDLALAPVRLDRHRPSDEGSVFRCGDDEVRFALTGAGAELAAGGRLWGLVPDRAASGARYAAPGDAGTFFWSKGDGAILSLDGEMRACVAARALPSFPLTAQGNEPFWRLDAAAGRIRLSADLGARVTEAPFATALATAEGERYAAAGADLAFTLVRSLCRDSMTGMPHPFAVTVEAAGQGLRGCGGAPAALLDGTSWRVTAIGGAAVPEGQEVTLAFEGGRAVGRSACNRYSGDFEITGEGLAFGAVASTMMACDAAAMRSERRFLDRLAAVTRFDFAPDGALVLYAGDTAVVTARR